MIKRLLILFVLLTQTASAGPRQLARSIGSQFKRTFYTDVKAHPIVWGIPLALQFAIAFSDTGSSCVKPDSYTEVGYSKHFVGSYPKCHKYIVWTAASMAAHATAENWLANSLKDSCDREAANPNSQWWRTPSHTKSTTACYWSVPLADTVVTSTYEIPIIKHNIDILPYKRP